MRLRRDRFGGRRRRARRTGNPKGDDGPARHAGGYHIGPPAARYHLGPRTLQTWELRGDLYIAIDPWFTALELGLAEWEGAFEGATGKWLRWTRRDGSFLPTGFERAEAEAKRAEAAAKRAEAEAKRADLEAQRADRLAEKLRALGIEP